MRSELLLTFLSVAEKACSEYHVFVEPDIRECYDAYCGRVSEFAALRKLNPRHVEDGLKESVPGRIILILESPHKEEFANKGDVWPVQGRSGDNIRMYLPSIVPERMHGWGVFAVNAIQYQCSQGLNLERGFNRAAKNYVVGNLLHLKVFRDGLRDRVRPFVVQKGGVPCVFLNACTSYAAHNIGKANKILINEILATIKGVRIFDELPHPSCWNKQNSLKMWRNRIQEWYFEIQKYGADAVDDSGKGSRF